MPLETTWKFSEPKSENIPPPRSDLALYVLLLI